MPCCAWGAARRRPMRSGACSVHPRHPEHGAVPAGLPPPHLGTGAGARTGQRRLPTAPAAAVGARQSHATPRGNQSGCLSSSPVSRRLFSHCVSDVPRGLRPRGTRGPGTRRASGAHWRQRQPRPGVPARSPRGPPLPRGGSGRASTPPGGPPSGGRPSRAAAAVGGGVSRTARVTGCRAYAEPR